MAKYTKTAWHAGRLITRNDMEKIEDQFEMVTPGATNVAENYKSSETYSKGDYCLYDGELWKCIATPVGTDEEKKPKDNSTYWTKTKIMNETNSGISQSIANEYKENQNYEIGDYVTYHTDLYRCIEATHGAWNSQKWELVILSNDITDLISVQNQQPDNDVNKIWIKKTGDSEVTLLTKDEIEENYCKTDTIAPTFSASTAYAAGDYVYYDGELYRFTVDHTAGAWTGADAKRTMVGDEIVNVTHIIDSISDGTRNVNTAVTGRYSVNQDTGVISETTSQNVYGISNPVEIESDSTYTMTFFGIGSSNDRYAVYIAYYDSTLTYISGAYINRTITNAKGIYTVMTPATAKFMAVSIYAPNLVLSNENIQIEAGSTSTEYVDPFTAVDEIARNHIELLETWKDFDLPNGANGFIRYSDGVLVSSQTAKYYTIKNIGYSKMRIYGYSGSTSLASVAFYSSNNIDSNSYLLSASVRFSVANSAYWEVITIPQQAKLIVLSDTVTDFTPLAQLLASEYDLYMNQKIESASKAYGIYGYPFAFDRQCDHLFIRQVTNPFSSEIIIPCQSVFHVNISKRLGFKYIECNTQKTFDNRYIVTHGIAGKFGNDIQTVDGQSASDVTISTLTFAQIRENYKYRSKYEYYQVPVTSLEEFLYACVENGIKPVLQYRDRTMLNIARSIVGDNMILYNGVREAFEGYIITFNSLTTVESIIAKCNEYGAPYIYGMDNTESFTDSELKEIVNAVHENGYYIGFAGAYHYDNENERCHRVGFDLDITGSMVNPFESGNAGNYISDESFSDFTITGGTVNDGALTLSSGGTVETPTISGQLVKFMIKIIFNGTITANGYQYESDGLHTTIITGYRFDVGHGLYIVANANTEIYMLKYVVSKC